MVKFLKYLVKLVSKVDDGSTYIALGYCSELVFINLLILHVY